MTTRTRAPLARPDAGTPGTLPARLGRAWLAMALAVLFAFSWQSVVVETHVHPAAGAGAGLPFARGDAAPRLRDDPGPAKAPASCPLCREQAQAGHALPPPPIVLPVPPAGRLAPRPTAPLAGAGPRHVHVWYSRGPPASPPSR